MYVETWTLHQKIFNKILLNFNCVVKNALLKYTTLQELIFTTFTEILLFCGNEKTTN